MCLDTMHVKVYRTHHSSVKLWLVGTSQKWPSIVIDHSQLFGVTVYIILLTGRLDNGLIWSDYFVPCVCYNSISCEQLLSV